MQKEINRPPSIRIAFRTFGRTLRHGYENLGSLGVCSVLWLVLAILVVPWGPATAALHRVTQRMTEDRASPAHRFWEHFRADWGWSSALVWTLILGLVVWEGNRRFYINSGNSTLLLFSGFFFVIILLWFGVMLFAMPLALRQTDRRLRTTLRNTVIVVLANLPGVVVSLVLLFVSCLVLFIIPPLFLLIPGWIALWGEENVRLLLVAAGHLPPDEIADRPRVPRS
jgi:uncharacterized membrane protein YesL